MASLADWIKSQTADYGQLKNAYPNAMKFGSALKKGISDLVPTQEELNNPNAMSERAMNYINPMAGTLGVSKNLNAGLLEKYLSTGKLSPEDKSQLLIDAQNELPDYYNATIKDLKKRGKPINDEKVYAVLKTKLLGRQQYLNDQATPQTKLWNPAGFNKKLTELGFDETGNNTSYHNDISSNSTYFSHPQTGVKIRLSDHAPVYARSTGNDIQLYPGSYQSDDDALNSILSLIGRK